MMPNYRSNFRGYLNDLSKRKPAPGGGSAVCLMACLGIALIEKAVNYSVSEKKALQKYLRPLSGLRKKIFPGIDLDGKIFERILRAKKANRTALLKKSERIIMDTAKVCVEAFSLAKEAESGIKKNIISDFYIGRQVLKTALKGCIMNLEANQKIFGKINPAAENFKTILRKWQ